MVHYKQNILAWYYWLLYHKLSDIGKRWLKKLSFISKTVNCKWGSCVGINWVGICWGFTGREMCRGIQEIKHEDVFYLMSSSQISHVLHYFPHFQIQNNLLHCVWNVIQRSIWNMCWGGHRNRRSVGNIKILWQSPAWWRSG